MEWIKGLTPIQKTVIFAALAAMSQDIHTPQDNLSELEWEEVDKMWAEIEAEMNSKKEQYLHLYQEALLFRVVEIDVSGVL